ncbi:hypothetical protein NHX12_017258 [Muraenolepis orangiensis]|uniref:BOS complex subunit NCLN n=1 Tax=Muraenolepis orangiensis TaxID=630683 RepID=A0A9Q0IZ42_9TELE|nr:hypothetical protein NHX12_017258 [Muraenolepis orangiensis]
MQPLLSGAEHTAAPEERSVVDPEGATVLSYHRANSTIRHMTRDQYVFRDAVLYPFKGVWILSIHLSIRKHHDTTGTPGRTGAVMLPWRWMLPLTLLLLCVPSSLSSILPAASSYEFTAYRMQQYHLGQQKHGCSGAIVVAEARSADEPVLTRRCVVMKVSDFTTEKYLEAQRQSAAAIFILFPRNASALPPDVVQSFMVSESEVLQRETLIPVYVVPEDDQLLCMYEEVKRAAASQASSILVRVLRSMVTAMGFQILVGTNSAAKPNTDAALVTLEGVLPGAGVDPPTVVISAHYDSYGLAPWLSHGADSNASGVTLLLELVRLFQKLYSNSRTRPPYNLMFSLTGGGKYNFWGTKKWIEENMDHSESSLLHDNVAFVLCLDTLANGDELYMHVSRPPRPDSPFSSFIQHLEEVKFPWVSLEMVHKKINLVESTVSWEHERYGLRRIPGFTLSHLEDPRSELRGSILDTMSQVDFRKLKRNGVLVAESLARFMYNLSDKGSPREVQVFKGHMDLQDSRLSSLMSLLTSVPRASQLDGEPPQAVKPAAFDLFLGGCIAAYLGIVYYAIQVCLPVL